MKKMISRFLKDTRGVIFMEYVVLGLFAAAVCVAAVCLFGKATSNGFQIMANATVANNAAVQAAVPEIKAMVAVEDAALVDGYQAAFDDTAATISVDEPVIVANVAP